MNEPQFDDLSEVYESMIDWPKRLGNEGPFFRRVFDGVKVKHVADVACGTGRHAALFHSWGLEVQGSDISPGMIAIARETFGEPAGLNWVVRGFEEPAGPAGSFDAVVCVGNSLALASDVAMAGTAIRQMLEAVRPGGVVIVHLLNLWKFPAGKCVWQKVIRRTLAQGPSLILKGVHRTESEGYVELLVVADDGSEKPAARTHSARFLGIRAEMLDEMARENRASAVSFYGDHHDQPYDPATSTDLIMVARK